METKLQCPRCSELNSLQNAECQECAGSLLNAKGVELEMPRMQHVVKLGTILGIVLGLVGAAIFN